MYTYNKVKLKPPYLLSLDGDWDFAYTHGQEGLPSIPEDSEFQTKLSVPGYWDDQIEKMQATIWWAGAKFNPNYRHIDFPLGSKEEPPDASLPYLVGIGWYRSYINFSAVWKNCSVVLQIGGVVLESWVWLNKKLAGYHLGHSTPFEINLDERFRKRGENELIIAVSNTRTDRVGCVISGYKGLSGGIYRPIGLKITGGATIKNCYLWAENSNKNIRWRVELNASNSSETYKDLEIQWSVGTIDKDKIVNRGKIPVEDSRVEWITDSGNMKPWSDNEPNLYKIELILKKGNKVLDCKIQKYGLRTLACDGTRLTLNGRPIILRGILELAYFPETCTAPIDIEYYRNRIRKMKEIGFNWIRCHTWVPCEEYLQAGDELGVMFQIEPPMGYEEQEWRDIIESTRIHPSVVIYCSGNEELLNEKKIDTLRRHAKILRELDPCMLYNPQEALRGVEYGWCSFDMGKDADVVKKPFSHNRKRLELLKRFSDIFGQYSWGRLSYGCRKADWQMLDQRLKVYERPCLSHEVGIIGSYLNLDLEHRYIRSRIGIDLFASVRKNLEKAGLLDKSSLYYKNSCAWMRTIRKNVIEMARKCRNLVGYDFLGGYDMHWHQCGYPCGILNEFFEFKPGDSVENILKSNGESVILLDQSTDRNTLAGERFKMNIMSSLYGREPLKDGCLSWYVKDAKGNIYVRGKIEVKNIPNGEVVHLGFLEFTVPGLHKPAKLTIAACLSGDEYEVVNDWDFWAFPRKTVPDIDAVVDENVMQKIGARYTSLKKIGDGQKPKLMIVHRIDKDALKFLIEGGNVLLLGHTPFPPLISSFQPSCAGRNHGNLATVIYNHPVLKEFPHDGFCDWQFFSLLEEKNGATTINFNEINIPFDPIVEIASSFKIPIKQSNLFELRVGKGNLMVCSMGINLNDKATIFLLDSLFKYVDTNNFRPSTIASVDEFWKLLKHSPQKPVTFKISQAYNPNVMNRN